MSRSRTVVHVATSFHYDVAYCKTFEGYLDASFKCLVSGLRLLRRYPAFTFNIEQVILVREFWERLPRYRKAMQRYATQGRLSFAPGMFTMPDVFNSSISAATLLATSSPPI